MGVRCIKKPIRESDITIERKRRRQNAINTGSNV